MRIDADASSRGRVLIHKISYMTSSVLAFRPHPSVTGDRLRQDSYLITW